MEANLIEDLRWRGLLYDQTEGAEEAIAAEKVTGYIGFDPTSDSLHVGNLLPIMGLVRMQQYGHTPIALVGGATGMIGDPSGKSKERNLLDVERLQHNVDCIRRQLARFLDFDCAGNPAKLVNNHDWLGPMSFIEFMRDVGKNFPMAYMLAKESVKRRLDGEGISFTEFSYMLLQSYDFYHLYRQEGCTLQMGGSDQWGNITAGKELIRRMGAEARAHGVVFPLVTNSSGEKFGKTVDGAVWLDAEKTSPYRFYQFWVNVGDEDAIRYLKFFSTRGRAELEALEASHAEAPHQREAQKQLAAEITERVHGADQLARALRATEAIFGGRLFELPVEELAAVAGDVPSIEEARDGYGGEGRALTDLLVALGAAKSKGDARRTIQGGGVVVNGQKIENTDQMVTLADSIDGAFIAVRKGRKNNYLVKLTE